MRRHAGSRETECARGNGVWRLPFAGVICLGLPFHDEHPSSRGLLDKHTFLVLQVLQRSCLRMLAPDLCSSEECTSIFFCPGTRRHELYLFSAPCRFREPMQFAPQFTDAFLENFTSFLCEDGPPSVGCLLSSEEHKKSVSSVIDRREFSSDLASTACCTGRSLCCTAMRGIVLCVAMVSHSSTDGTRRPPTMISCRASPGVILDAVLMNTTARRLTALSSSLGLSGYWR